MKTVSPDSAALVLDTVQGLTQGALTAGAALLVAVIAAAVFATVTARFL